MRAENRIAGCRGENRPEAVELRGALERVATPDRCGSEAAASLTDYAISAKGTALARRDVLEARYRLQTSRKAANASFRFVCELGECGNKNAHVTVGRLLEAVARGMLGSGKEEEAITLTDLDRYAAEALVVQALRERVPVGASAISSTKEAVAASRGSYDMGLRWTVRFDWSDGMFEGGSLLDAASRAMDALTAGDSRLVSILRRTLNADVGRKWVLPIADASPLCSLIREHVLTLVADELGRCGHRVVVHKDGVVVFVRSERAAGRVAERIRRLVAELARVDAGEMLSICKQGDLAIGGLSVGSGSDSTVSLSKEAYRKLLSELRGITKRSSGEGYMLRKRRLNACLRRWAPIIRLCDDAGQLVAALDDWLAMRLNALYIHENARVRSRVSLYRRWGLRRGLADALARSRAGSWAISRSRADVLPGPSMHRANGFLFFSDMVPAR